MTDFWELIEEDEEERVHPEFDECCGAFCAEAGCCPFEINNNTNDNEDKE